MRNEEKEEKTEQQIKEKQLLEAWETFKTRVQEKEKEELLL